MDMDDFAIDLDKVLNDFEEREENVSNTKLNTSNKYPSLKDDFSEISTAATQLPYYEGLDLDLSEADFAPTVTVLDNEYSIQNGFEFVKENGVHFESSKSAEIYDRPEERILLNLPLNSQGKNIQPEHPIQVQSEQCEHFKPDYFIEQNFEPVHCLEPALSIEPVLNLEALSSSREQDSRSEHTIEPVQNMESTPDFEIESDHNKGPMQYPEMEPTAEPVQYVENDLEVETTDHFSTEINENFTLDENLTIPDVDIASTHLSENDAVENDGVENDLAEINKFDFKFESIDDYAEELSSICMDIMNAENLEKLSNIKDEQINIDDIDTSIKRSICSTENVETLPNGIYNCQTEDMKEMKDDSCSSLPLNGQEAIENVKIGIVVCAEERNDKNVRVPNEINEDVDGLEFDSCDLSRDEIEAYLRELDMSVYQDGKQFKMKDSSNSDGIFLSSDIIKVPSTVEVNIRQTDNFSQKIMGLSPVKEVGEKGLSEIISSNLLTGGDGAMVSHLKTDLKVNENGEIVEIEEADQDITTVESANTESVELKGELIERCQLPPIGDCLGVDQDEDSLSSGNLEGDVKNERDNCQDMEDGIFPENIEEKIDEKSRALEDAEDSVHGNITESREISGFVRNEVFVTENSDLNEDEQGMVSTDYELCSDDGTLQDNEEEISTTETFNIVDQTECVNVSESVICSETVYILDDENSSNETNVDPLISGNEDGSSVVDVNKGFVGSEYEDGDKISEPNEGSIVPKNGSIVTRTENNSNFVDVLGSVASTGPQSFPENADLDEHSIIDKEPYDAIWDDSLIESIVNEAAARVFDHKFLEDESGLSVDVDSKRDEIVEDFHKDNTKDSGSPRSNSPDTRGNLPAYVPDSHNHVTNFVTEDRANIPVHDHRSMQANDPDDQSRVSTHDPAHGVGEQSSDSAHVLLDDQKVVSARIPFDQSSKPAHVQDDHGTEPAHVPTDHINEPAHVLNDQRSDPVHNLDDQSPMSAPAYQSSKPDDQTSLQANAPESRVQIHPTLVPPNTSSPVAHQLHLPVCSNVNLALTQLGKVAPKWMPDNEAPKCLQCEIMFSFTRRRHHCRACGKIFCSLCSSFRVMLPYLENKEERVCSKCYQDFVRAQSYQIAEATVPNPRPNPDNPSEYCSTIPPELQANPNAPLPTVMVPTGVLRKASVKSRTESKQVMFSDGIRPGGDLTDLDGSSTVVRSQSSHHSSRRSKKSDKSVQNSTPAIRSAAKSSTEHKHSSTSFLSPTGLPPIVVSDEAGSGDLHFNPDVDSLMTQLRSENLRSLVTFIINKNLAVIVKIINLDCCVHRTCWCFTTKGLCLVGQDEIVFLLEVLPDEKTIPTDIFHHINQLYEAAGNGITVSNLSHSVLPTGAFASHTHGGFLYIRQTFQCLQKLTLPNPPFLFGILLQKWEMSWAKVFPLRLMFRLGAEFRYYPCPLIGVRMRKPVYGEIGHTIMNLLADFHNYQYTVANIDGLFIHMEDRKTTVNLPKNKYNDVMKLIHNSDDHVMAIGASFSPNADSHLVCLQNEDGNYQTQAINIQNRPRKVTGACFIVFNGALKPVSGFLAKSSIIEDGIMVQITSEAMLSLKQAMKEMKDYTINCGSIESIHPDEVVTIQWVESESNRNAGIKSPVDGASLSGVESIRIHSGTEFAGGCDYSILWTEVFLLKNNSSESQSFQLPDISQLAEPLAHACCLALSPHLPHLSFPLLSKVGLRVTCDSDQIGYEAGANGSRLPNACMSDLDERIIPVMHSSGFAGRSANGGFALELVFHVLKPYSITVGIKAQT